MNIADLIRANKPGSQPPPKPKVKTPDAPSRNAETEAKVLTWIASLTGDSKGEREKFEDFLHDGVVLCKLINRLAPGAVKRIGKKGEAAAMENINAFRAAAKAYGVPEVKVFLAPDLFNKQNIAEVLKTLVFLGKQTQKHPEYDGPPFEV